jgi:hypothetical protein
MKIKSLQQPQPFDYTGAACGRSLCAMAGTFYRMSCPYAQNDTLFNPRSFRDVSSSTKRNLQFSHFVHSLRSYDYTWS